jgi:CDP-glucose 4,6-dehydratase
VIGGGDWGRERLVPDAIRALQQGVSDRGAQPPGGAPWQHVLDPLAGYLLLAERLSESLEAGSSQVELPPPSLNFGPEAADQRTVQELVEELLRHCPGRWQGHHDPQAPRESATLLLDASEARRRLGWQPRWEFCQAVAHTARWYQAVQGTPALELCLEQLRAYEGGLCPHGLQAVKGPGRRCSLLIRSP